MAKSLREEAAASGGYLIATAAPPATPTSHPPPSSVPSSPSGMLINTKFIMQNIFLTKNYATIAAAASVRMRLGIPATFRGMVQTEISN